MVNILLYKPTNVVVAVARSIEERIADSTDPLIGALLERFGAAKRIMPMLNLTFDEPTQDERLLLNPDLQVAELLGAKTLDRNGTPVRVLAYRYQDGYIVFSCKIHTMPNRITKAFREEFIINGFSNQDDIWPYLLSYMPKLA